MLIKHLFHTWRPVTNTYHSSLYRLAVLNLRSDTAYIYPKPQLLEGGTIRYFYSTIGWPNLFDG